MYFILHEGGTASVVAAVVAVVAVVAVLCKQL